MLRLAQHQRQDHGEDGGGEKEQPGQVELAPLLPGVRGQVSRARATKAIPIGTLTRKTDRQPRPAIFALISTPPAICPATVAPARMAEYLLIARTLASPVKVRWIRLSTCGIISAAPAPWANRSPISCPAEVAIPQPSEVEREHGEPGLEHPAVPEDVAEPGAGHQQDRVGDRVADHDELPAGAGRPQAGMNRRHRDVDH